MGGKIIGCVENDLVNLDIFRVERYDTYTTLQAPISIPNAIHIANVVGSVILRSIDLVANVASGGEENDLDRLDEYAGGSRDFKIDG
jgi:hypothetical protein